jgi:hypothetical protein
MQRSHILSTALVAWLAQGCVIVSDDSSDDDGNNPPPPTQGAFRTSWSITQTGAATTCAAVGAEKVAFLSTKVGTTMGFDDQFPCADLAGDTGPLAIGNYTISVDVLDAAGTPLNPTPANLQDGFNNGCDSVEGANICIVNLPNVEFAFSAN